MVESDDPEEKAEAKAKVLELSLKVSWGNLFLGLIEEEGLDQSTQYIPQVSKKKAHGLI